MLVNKHATAAGGTPSSRGKATGLRIARIVLILALVTSLLPQVLAAAEGPADAEPTRPKAQPIDVQAAAATDMTGQSTVVIPVTKTSYISSAQPNTNFGDSDIIRIGYDAGSLQAMRILVQFDLSRIPAGSVINWATLQVYESDRVPANDGAMGFRAQMMVQPWDQYGVTWNNANYLGGAGYDVVNEGAALGWWNIGVTDAIRDWVSGAVPNNGTIITGDETPSANRSRTFIAPRHGSLTPVLTVDYTSGCTSPTPLATINALPQFSPGSFTVSWSLQPAPGGCAPAPVSRYDVQFYLNGVWHDWISTTATSAVFSGAADGAVVQFRVRAVDQSGNTQQWSGAQASTQIDSVPPFATMSPLPPYTTSQAFVVSWGGSDNLSGIAYYDVEFEQDMPTWQNLAMRTTATSYQITGAQNGVHYSFRCRAVDNAGNVQPWSLSAQASTTVALYPVAQVRPFVPAVLKPSGSGPDSFTVVWDGTTVGGVANTGYSVYYNYNDQGWTLWSDFPGRQTSAAFDWRSTGHGDGAYSFEAVATNALGETEPRRGKAEATIIVDMADRIQPQSYLPLVARITMQ